MEIPKPKPPAAPMQKPKMRGVMVVRDAQGRIKLDEGFDVSVLTPEEQQEIRNGNVVYSRP